MSLKNAQKTMIFPGTFFLFLSMAASAGFLEITSSVDDLVVLSEKITPLANGNIQLDLVVSATAACVKSNIPSIDGASFLHEKTVTQIIDSSGRTVGGSGGGPVIFTKHGRIVAVGNIRDDFSSNAECNAVGTGEFNLLTEDPYAKVDRGRFNACLNFTTTPKFDIDNTKKQELRFTGRLITLWPGSEAPMN